MPLEEVLRLARPAFGLAGQQAAAPQKPTGSARQAYEAQARPAPKGAPSPVTGTPLGVQFVDVAREAGLNVEMIFGGEHRNKYLLETTGCGAAFFDYDQDDWPGTGLPPVQEQPRRYIYRRDPEIRSCALRLGPGLLRGRLQQ